MAPERTERLNDANILTADLKPCNVQLAPRFPKRPDQGPPIGIALSGGGFRATFAALGVVRYLADVGLLGNLWISSSVSGGSVANGIIATHWDELRSRGFTAAAVDELLIDPTVEKIAKKSLKTHLVKNVWRIIGSKNRTDLLARAFDDWFMGDTTMDQLDPGVRWVINAANMATATRFTFERDMIGDYANGFLPMSEAKTKVALAAAASAAVPGAFAPIELAGLGLPCRGEDTVSLLDGGAYDNTGIEVLNSTELDDVFTICLEAGGIFKVGAHMNLPLVRDLKLANSVLYRQSRALRTRDMVERFKDPKSKREGCVFKLNTSRDSVEQPLKNNPEALALVGGFVDRYPEIDDYQGTKLADVATSFDRFAEGLSRRLVYRGWWTTGLTMVAFNDHLPGPSATTTAPPV